NRIVALVEERRAFMTCLLVCRSRVVGLGGGRGSLLAKVVVPAFPLSGVLVRNSSFSSVLDRNRNRAFSHLLADSSDAGRRGAGGASARVGGRETWADDSPLPGGTGGRRLDGPARA